jgi:hypothetical protein
MLFVLFGLVDFGGLTLDFAGLFTKYFRKWLVYKGIVILRVEEEGPGLKPLYLWCFPQG